MAKKAVIFDLDGTLVDSIPFHFKRHRDFFKKKGINITRDYYEERCNGSSPHDFFRTILLDFDGNDHRYEEILKEDEELKKRRDLSSIKTFSGVKTVLKNLKKQDFALAVASSSNKKYVLQLLKQNNIEQYFDYVVGGNEVKHSKPDPHIFLLARSEVGIKKSECVIIEDAKQGVIAAKRAGIDCLCLLTSEKREDIPKSAIIVEKHSLIPEIIANLK